METSILQQVKWIEFFRLQINTEGMTLSLSKEKLNHTFQRCLEVYSQPKTSVLNLKSTLQAILPATIQFRFLWQQKQILVLKGQGWYKGLITLDDLERKGLLWWIGNIKLSNGRKIQQQEPQMTIQTNVSTWRWSAHCKRLSTGEKWSKWNKDSEEMF